ncbi:hypothetical protein IC614_06705 [Allosphingosinicella flava]|uniref:Colicin transporter n=1 Tax=Allosphingosinicella flava TaxID=2771430 RepID=A0A7T2GI05_9SPHN|nr:hypothetical protein [Sphingosinicella flava]QPQ54062.1 hypothetical protein IC614_06705 [Sphingosinicella flava]
MMAQGFRSVGWVAGVGAAALGCYMLSLQVASERAELARVERSIIAAKQDIRSLQTELGTRGRLSQLEQWNAEVLALSAPATNQFLSDQVMLARFETHERTVEERVPVRMASHETVTVPDQDAATAQPRLIQAAANVPAGQPLLRKASLETAGKPASVLVKSASVTSTEKTAPKKAAVEKAVSPVKKAEAPKPAKSKTNQVKSAGLLSDDVLGDIVDQSKNETRGGGKATR